MPNPGLMSSHQYRPDIDGLRAVAILSVLFFHAGSDVISGGFIGVDVFLVISGYLITTLIYAEIAAGNFSYTAFYRRRIQRLLPALITVLLVTTVVAVLLMTPKDLQSYSKALLSTMLAASNMYFWRENGVYFGGNTQEVPLLHTWSLSVEEQFYLVWPVFLVICHKLFGRRWFGVAIAATLLLSIFISEFVTHVTFAAAYYLLPTRMFELAIGAVLAVYWAHLPVLGKRLANAIAAIGLLLVMIPMCVMNHGTPFPGVNALYPTVGTAMLIYAGKGGHSFINNVLGLRPLVLVGLISYSLYLWHWPVIVFYRYMGNSLDLLSSTACVLVSLLLSVVTWRYVETPARVNRSWGFGFLFSRLYLLPLVATLAFVGLVSYADGLPARFPKEIQQMEQALASQPELMRSGCHSPTRDASVPANRQCRLGDLANASRSALLIGDSHANHFTGFLDELGRSTGVMINDYTLDGCLPLNDLYWGRNSYYADVCKRRNDQVAQLIDQNAYDLVILAGQWPRDSMARQIYLEGRAVSVDDFRAAFKSRFVATVEMIAEANAVPVIVKDVPSIGRIVPNCVVKQRLYDEDLECKNDKQALIQGAAYFDALIDEARQRVPSIVVIDPKRVACDEHYCYSALGGMPLYRDANHLNDEGARLLGRKYLQQEEVFQW